MGQYIVLQPTKNPGTLIYGSRIRLAPAVAVGTGPCPAGWLVGQYIVLYLTKKLGALIYGPQFRLAPAVAAGTGPCPGVLIEFLF